MLKQIIPSQIPGARGMLDWSTAELAHTAGLSISTIKRMEMATPQPISESAYGSMREAFEAAGNAFLEDLGDGCGVRLRGR